MFNETDFFDFILNNDLLKFGEYTLASGRTSHFKVDWEKILTTKRTLDYVVNCVITKVEDLHLKPDVFIGVPDGVTQLGVATQLKWSENRAPDLVVTSRRDKPGYVGDLSCLKGTGTGIYLEDTVTTGGTLLRELDKAKAHRLNIVGVIALTDRMQLTDEGEYVKDVMEERGITYARLSSAPSLLVGAYAKGPINDEMAGKIQAEYSHLREGWLLGK